MTTENNEVEEHSPVGPSAAHRWMRCPGSVTLTKDLEQETSPYAEEGTLAHELAEHILLVETEQAEDKPFARHEEVTEEMEQYVRQYTSRVLGEWNRCQQKEGDTIRLQVERRVHISIDSRLHGTVDAMFVCPSEGRVYVFDLKYGKGVEVSVDGNEQLLYYALAGWESSFSKEVVLTIIQPRVQNSYKRVHYYKKEMREFAEALGRALKDVDEKPEQYSPSQKACKWCLASSFCPAKRVKFEAVTDISLRDDIPNFPLIDNFSLEQLGHIYNHHKEFTDWLNKVQEKVEELNRKGLKVPYSKMVKQRKNRVIKDEKKFVQAAQRKKWRKKDLYHLPKLKSPKQLEDLGVPRELVEKHTIIPQGGTVLAHESDKREAVAIPQFDSVVEEGKVNG